MSEYSFGIYMKH
ncbi:Protein of unknown function [Bacillus cereus]|nr:Protein of unknown function [Bacillus cereus]